MAVISYSASAQQARLEVSNLAPRVGDEITVSVVYYDANQPEKERDPHFNNLARVDFKTSKLITKTGSLWIGPFTFNIGEQTLTTDSVELQVTDALPLKDSIVVRQVEISDGKYKEEFLIVEQIKKNKKQKYVNLKEDDIGKTMILIEEKNKFESSFNEKNTSYYFTRQTYSLAKRKTYDGGIFITANNFKNFPANSYFKSYEIQ